LSAQHETPHVVPPASIARQQPLFGPRNNVELAALAVDCGVEALAEAEALRASNVEIVQLCDEIIARRLRLQMMTLNTGWRPAAGTLAQMARDRELLRQPTLEFGE